MLSYMLFCCSAVKMLIFWVNSLSTFFSLTGYLPKIGEKNWKRVQRIAENKGEMDGQSWKKEGAAGFFDTDDDADKIR